jgi:hypothetical protein
MSNRKNVIVIKRGSNVYAFGKKFVSDTVEFPIISSADKGYYSELSEKHSIVLSRNDTNFDGIMGKIFGKVAGKHPVNIILRDLDGAKHYQSNDDECLSSSSCILAFIAKRDLVFEKSSHHMRCSKNSDGNFFTDENGFNEYHLCTTNPFKDLSRNYDDENDWQFNNGEIENESLRKLAEVMKRYHSYNVSWHAGNLYEHSVWTLLKTERILSLQPVNNLISYEFENPDDVKLAISLAAFIHDIGKIQLDMEQEYRHLANQNSDEQKKIYTVTPNNEKFFQTVPKHETAILLDSGYKFIVRDIVHSYFNEIVGKRMSDSITNAIIAFIPMHRIVGDIVQKNRRISPSELIKSISEKTWDFLSNDPVFKDAIDTLSHTFNDEKLFAMMVAVVSTADMISSTPPISKNLTNIKSTYFPGIANVSKIYPGGKLGRSEDECIRLIPDIYSTILTVVERH